MLFFFNFYFFSSLIFCFFLIFFKNQEKQKFFILYSLIFSFFCSIFFFFIIENKLKITNLFIIFNFLNIKYLNFLFIWSLDSFSLIFVSLTTFILILSTVWSWNYCWNTKPLYIFFLFLDFLLKGCFFAFDIFTFFLFFESILIVILYLIGILGTHERKVKAIYFFYVYTLLGSFFILLGILILYFEVGNSGLFILNNLNLTFQKQIFLWPFVSLSFLIKIPIFPFHIWLPEAHVEASTLGSVFLASILLKLGGFGFLKFLIPLFPFASIYYTPIIEIFCCLGFFCCGLDALRQVDAKKIIAYSSVVHMNLVVLAIFTNTLKGLIGGLLMMISHGLTSAGIFFCLGALYDRYLTRNILYFKGLVVVMPLFCTLMFIFILTNIGFPGSLNFISEVLCIAGILQYSFSFSFFFLFFGLLINTYFNFWFFNRVFFGSLKSLINWYYSFPKYIIKKKYQDLSKREFFVLFVLIFWLFFWGFFPEKLINFVQIHFVYLNLRSLS